MWAVQYAPRLLKVITVAELDVKRESLPPCAQANSVIVAYSGGADSAYLAWAAHRALVTQWQCG
jgi:PP-loop superfamily ATP-utilizing enzyme